MTWIAELFRDNLDPRLRIYLEYGNEPWNGNMTGYYFTQYATHFNLNVNPSSSNPPWDNQEAAYAICSQHAWTIWESVFSGPRGLLSPTKLTVDPKQQDRRLVRVCSVNQGGTANAQDIFRYAQPYCTNPYGIPYDAICSNWYISMLNPAETVVELSTAPNSYPRTLDQLIPLCYLEATSQLEGCSSTHKQCMTDNFIDYTGAHQGIGSFLGFDKDGQPITPAYCLYEGGWGSPGPSQYMLYCIIQLRFEVDGQDTVYNIYKQSFDWWAKEVALETSDKNKKIMMLNLWETPKPWGHPDQWGIVDKSMYSSPEYQGFPVPRAVSYSAGNLPTSSSRSAAVSNPNNPSQPYCLVGSSWQRLVNIYIINESGQWQLVPASIIKYLGTDNEFH
jgi:hypothetical protein